MEEYGGSPEQAKELLDAQLVEFLRGKTVEEFGSTEVQDAIHAWKERRRTNEPPPDVSHDELNIRIQIDLATLFIQAGHIMKGGSILDGENGALDQARELYLDDLCEEIEGHISRAVELLEASKQAE